MCVPRTETLTNFWLIHASSRKEQNSLDVYLYGHVSADACRVQKRASDPLKLKQLAGVSCQMWVLGTKPGRLQEWQTLLTTEPPLWAPVYLSFQQTVTDPFKQLKV